MKVYNHYNDYPMSAWRWPSFSPQEIACRDDRPAEFAPHVSLPIDRYRKEVAPGDWQLPTSIDEPIALAKFGACDRVAVWCCHEQR